MGQMNKIKWTLSILGIAGTRKNNLDVQTENQILVWIFIRSVMAVFRCLLEDMVFLAFEGGPYPSKRVEVDTQILLLP